MNLVKESNSHFLQLCKLSQLGFRVVNGTLILGDGVPRIDYEFEPGLGVHCTQMIDNEKFHRFIRFVDLGL